MIKIELTQNEILVLVEAIGWAEGAGAYDGPSDVLTKAKESVSRKLKEAVKP